MDKEEIIKYLENNEMDVQRANASFIAPDIIYSSYANSHIVHGVDCSPIFCHFIKEKGVRAFHQIISKKKIKEIALKIYGEYLENSSNLKKRIKHHTRLQKNIDKLWKTYAKIRKEWNPKAVSSFFYDFDEISKDIWYYTMIGEDHGAIIHDVLVPKFARKHNMEIQEAAEKFDAISHPSEQTIYNKERKDFLSICLMMLESKKNRRKIKNYIDKYFWIRTDYCKAQVMTEESLLEEIREHIKENGKEGIEKELKDITANFEKIQKEKNETLKKLTLDFEDKKDIYFAEKTIEWIDLRKEAYMKDFYYLFIIMEDASKYFGVSYEYLANYTTVEFSKLLENGELIDRSKRDNGIIMVYEKCFSRTEFLGKDAEEILGAATSFKKDEAIKGQVASRGKGENITGVAKIIFNPDKEYFNEGEILVTSQTRVEFVPLMRKAKAIITDEGGIACHAAIVSRELGIPCIIGTKIGTKVLKDGITIEIDISKGTVKKV